MNDDLWHRVREVGSKTRKERDHAKIGMWRKGKSGQLLCLRLRVKVKGLAL